MRKKYYVGLKRDGTRELIHTAFTPTQKDYPDCIKFIGPFITRIGALYCKNIGPYIGEYANDVSNCERLAK